MLAGVSLPGDRTGGRDIPGTRSCKVCFVLFETGLFSVAQAGIRLTFGPPTASASSPGPV